MFKPMWWIFFLAVGFYAATFAHDEIGTVHDDAIYILGAQSLWHGHFTKPYIVGNPPDSDRLPGFSLFLAPFVHVFGVSPMLKGLSVFLTLMSCLLLREVARVWVSESWALALVALFAFQANSGILSHHVMPEPLFLVMSLSLILGFRRLLMKERPLESWLFGVLLGGSCLVRPDGIALAAAALVAVGLSRTARHLSVPVFAPLLFFGLLVAIRNQLTTGTPSHYVEQWRSVFQQDHGLWGVGSGFYIAATTVVKSIFLEPFNPLRLKGIVTVSLLTVMLIAFFIRGIRQMSRRAPSPLTLFLIADVLFDLALHGLWPSGDERYLWPIMPLFLLVVVAGWSSVIIPSRRWADAATAVLAVAMVVIDVDKDSYVIYRSMPSHRSFEQRLPRQSLAWIQDHTPADSHVLSITPATVYLYTARSGWSDLPSETAAQFASDCRANHVAYVFYRPFLSTWLSSGLVSQIIRFWDASHDWVIQDPNHYPLVYSNISEGTEIFAVAESSRPGLQERIEKPKPL